MYMTSKPYVIRSSLTEPDISQCLVIVNEINTSPLTNAFVLSIDPFYKCICFIY
jgi:hypothetical protein